MWSKNVFIQFIFIDQRVNSQVRSAEIPTNFVVASVVMYTKKWMLYIPPRLLRSEELSLTGQGLLRFIELQAFRSVTGYSISIVNISKQDDGSVTGEILHWLDYPSVYNSQQTDLTEAVTLIQR